MNAQRKIALTQVAPGWSIEQARPELTALQRAELRARKKNRRLGCLVMLVGSAVLWFGIIAACTLAVRAHAAGAL